MSDGNLDWQTIGRPGYFGKQRDRKHANFDKAFGANRWRLVWMMGDEPPLTFLDACKRYYEESYYLWLRDQRPDLIDFVCTFHECYDNDPSNVGSGLDYSIQEQPSTHIQDIAIRNVLDRLGRRFESANPARLLEIRSHTSTGHVVGPGEVPFFTPHMIVSPTLVPSWANPGSVEDFWQSNKFLQAR